MPLKQSPGVDRRVGLHKVLHALEYWEAAAGPCVYRDHRDSASGICGGKRKACPKLGQCHRESKQDTFRGLLGRECESLLKNGLGRGLEERNIGDNCCVSGVSTE